MAEPPPTTNNKPIKNKTIIIGSNHHFLRSLKKFQ